MGSVGTFLLTSKPWPIGHKIYSIYVVYILYPDVVNSHRSLLNRARLVAFSKCNFASKPSRLNLSDFRFVNIYLMLAEIRLAFCF